MARNKGTKLLSLSWDVMKWLEGKENQSELVERLCKEEMDREMMKPQPGMVMCSICKAGYSKALPFCPSCKKKEIQLKLECETKEVDDAVAEAINTQLTKDAKKMEGKVCAKCGEIWDEIGNRCTAGCKESAPCDYKFWLKYGKKEE